MAIGNVRAALRSAFTTSVVASMFLSNLAFAQADAVYWGGPILTMEGDRPRYVEAVAVEDGKIVYAGKKSGVTSLQDADTATFDLAGKTMLPGFVDPHGHIFLGGIQALSANLLPPPDGEGSDISSLQKTLRGWMAANAETVDKVGVIVGFGYDNSQLEEVRHPTRQDLDAVSADVPILLVHQSTHIGVLNTAGLKAVGYTAETPDPEGGVIQREADGKTPNGVVEEIAFFTLLPKLLEAVGSAGVETFASAGAQSWAAFGYTTVQEGRSIPDTAAVMRKVAADGGFKVDVVTYVDLLVGQDYLEKNYSPDYTDHFRVAGGKMVIDGSPQGFTAWRDRPYYDPVGDYPEGYAGYASVDPETFKDTIAWTYANTIPVIAHANGEKAGDLLIDALTEAEKAYGKKDRRPVLIHGQFERFDQIARYKALGVIPSLFPMHTFYWGDWHAEHTVGPELAQNISPTQWYRKAGMIFTTHHDAPVALPDSMRVLWATVNRRTRSGKVLGPEQRVDTYTALRAMTIWPAFQIFEEDRKGSIKTGKLADFIILSADPLKTAPEDLDKIQVEETIKEGRTIWKRD
ncbi:amidohydrolase [Novosphingobium profundi]|uniref:amidohydrolase n=1 Tax=Novosphingobium profundi TaxID=1774954 RepID=UPI001CFE1076|nr:amidohydrolase [Novosphingobium profundi]